MNLFKTYLNEISDREKQDLKPKPIDDGALIKELILNIEDKNSIYRNDSLNFLIYNTLPGTTTAANEKAKFLKKIILGDTNIKEIADSWEKQTRPQPDMYEPVKIPYGPEAEMISGFKEGIQQLNYGDKAVLFIPYYLGYGERGYRIIPPRTNLVFEIELLEDPEEE